MIACYESSGTVSANGSLVWFAVNQAVFGATINNTACALVINAAGSSVGIVNSVPGYRYYFVVAW
jgi:hypothetical protein